MPAPHFHAAVLAQADSAVAMSQSERKRWDETKDWDSSLPDEP
jgi:hypothetical protein